MILERLDRDIPPPLRSERRIAERHGKVAGPGRGHRCGLERRRNVPVGQLAGNESRGRASPKRVHEFPPQAARHVRKRRRIGGGEDARVLVDAGIPLGASRQRMQQRHRALPSGQRARGVPRIAGLTEDGDEPVECPHDVDDEWTRRPADNRHQRGIRYRHDESICGGFRLRREAHVRATRQQHAARVHAPGIVGNALERDVDHGVITRRRPAVARSTTPRVARWRRRRAGASLRRTLSSSTAGRPAGARASARTEC